MQDINSLIKNKKILYSSLFFLMMSIFVIFLAILNNSTKDQNIDIETDPASGHKLAKTGYSSHNSDGILWVGYQELSNKGMSLSMTDNIKNTIREYAKYDWKKELKRVSLYKNSYSFGKNDDFSTDNLHEMRFALNVNEKDIFVSLISKGYEKYEIKLFSDQNKKNELRSFSYCSASICKPEAPKSLNVY